MLLELIEKNTTKTKTKTKSTLRGGFRDELWSQLSESASRLDENNKLAGSGVLTDKSNLDLSDKCMGKENGNMCIRWLLDEVPDLIPKHDQLPSEVVYSETKKKFPKCNDDSMCVASSVIESGMLDGKILKHVLSGYSSEPYMNRSELLEFAKTIGAAPIVLTDNKSPSGDSLLSSDDIMNGLLYIQSKASDPSSVKVYAHSLANWWNATPAGWGAYPAEKMFWINDVVCKRVSIPEAITASKKLADGLTLHVTGRFECSPMTSNLHKSMENEYQTTSLSSKLLQRLDNVKFHCMVVNTASNPPGSHWIAILVDVDNKTIEYANSLDYCNNRSYCEQNIENPNPLFNHIAIMHLMLSIGYSLLGDSFDIIDVYSHADSENQTNCNNCGVFALFHHLARVSGKNTTEQFIDKVLPVTSQEMKEFRNELYGSK